MGLRRAAAVLPLTLALAAGCGGTGDEGTVPPPAPDAGPTVGAEPGPAGEWQSCDNEEAGFTVSYPADWSTNEPDGLPACSVFDPDAIELPEASEIPLDLAVIVRREPVAQPELLEEDMFEEQLSVEETTVADRPAAGVESRATGAGLIDEGTVSYRYYVDLGGGETLIAETHDVPGSDYERNRRVLDEMLDTLELHERR